MAFLDLDDIGDAPIAPTKNNDKLELGDIGEGIDLSETFTMDQAPANNPLPPGMVKSMEGTSTLGVDDPKPARAGTIRGFNDPLRQGIAGLVKGGNVSLNMIESIDTPKEIWDDPARVLDYPRPYVNFAMGVGEWVTNKVAGAVMPDLLEGEDIEFPRYNYEFGSYPEKDTPMGRAEAKSKSTREEFVRRYEAEFKSKTGSHPYISEALSYAPDILTLFGGGAQNIPKVAGAIEGMLGGARAEQEGENVGSAKAMGFLGGLVGTKVAGAFMNRLSPREQETIRMISQSPADKSDATALLKFFEANPQFSPEMLQKGKTGNPVVDRILEQQRTALGEEQYKQYTDVMKSLGEKARTSLGEVTDEFANQSDKLYKEMGAAESDAWKTAEATIDNTSTVSTKELSSEIDEALKDSPEVVKSFARTIMQADSNAMAIGDVRKLRDEAVGDYNAAMSTANKSDKLKLTRKHRQDMTAFTKEIQGLKADAATAATELSPMDLIAKIQAINKKKNLAGGNINTGDKQQSAALMKLKALFEKKLEGTENFDAFNPAYQKAKQLSSDKFNTFGYKGGKNMGKDVFNPELGQIMGEAKPQQMQIVEDMMDLSPDVFNTKMQELGKTIDPATSKNLSKYYVEKKLKGNIVDKGGAMEVPRVAMDKFDTQISTFLDTADGRQMITDTYGKEVVDQLSLVRSLGKELGRAADEGRINESVLKAWTSDLPGTIKSVFTQQIADYMYVRRNLEGYGEKVKFDWMDTIKDQAASRVVGGGIGATVAPEGHEAEGAFLGGIAGKYASVFKMLKNTKLGQKATDKVKNKFNSMRN